MIFQNFALGSARFRQLPAIITFGLIIVGSSAFWFGCASENPNLVNPPGGLDSVYVRFINFASDGEGRILSLDKTIQTSLVLQNTSSSIINSPSDTSITTVMHNGTDEYRPVNKFRFSRSSYQTLIALPSGSSAAVKRPVDTLIPIYTPFVSSSTKATVRLMNCNPDSTKKYSLRLGCENGVEIGYDNGYRTQSSEQELPGGRIGVTLVERSFDSSRALDLYECTIDDRGSYTFFVAKDANGRPSLYQLNERGNNGDSAFIKLVAIPQRTASIRTVNLSKSSIDINRIANNSSSSVVNGIGSGSVSDYVSVSACGSFSADSFSVKSSGTSIVTASLEALKRYTLLAFDDSHTYPAIIIPEQSGTVPSGKASVRVVNSLYSSTPITVSLGATTDATAPNGFSSGVILASNLIAGEFSLPAYLTPGELPITVFTSRSPAALLYGSAASLSADKKYLLIISSEANDITKATLIEDNQNSGNAGLLPRGSFVEIVHAIGETQTITAGFDRVLSNAKLYFSNSIATILPSGSRTLSINDIGSLPINVSPDSSILAIVTGMSVSDILLFSSPVSTILPSSSRRRYINASKDISAVKITQDSLNGSVISPGLSSRTSVDVPAVAEQRITLVFSNPATGKELIRIENVSFPLGKNYSIIFIGSSDKYSAIIEQEF